MELSHNQTYSTLAYRRSNILKDMFKRAQIQCQEKDNKTLSLVNKDKINADISLVEEFKQSYRTKRAQINQYWFLKHEKLFHNRTKKLPLIPLLKKKRVKSAKKKNKYRAFEKLDAIRAKEFRLKHKLKKHQKSIFEAVRKYGKTSGKSKSSASTVCTITKINTHQLT